MLLSVVSCCPSGNKLGHDNYCNRNFCGENEGDCDHSNQCTGDLKCGCNNCHGVAYDRFDDCCSSIHPEGGWWCRNIGRREDDQNENRLHNTDANNLDERSTRAVLDSYSPSLLRALHAVDPEEALMRDTQGRKVPFTIYFLCALTILLH